MYAAYIVRRTQIYLEDDQHKRLADKALADGVTVSAVIRQAIDNELSRPEDDVQWRERWRQAVNETAGIAPYLPDGVTYVDEVRDEERRRRAQER